MGGVRRDSVDTRQKSRVRRVPETAMTISGVKREGQKGGRKERPACHTRTRTIAENPQARASRVTTMPSWKSAYKGQLVQVEVLTEGFAYAGRIYASLSAVAKTITGSHTNGYHFFRNTLNHNKETA